MKAYFFLNAHHYFCSLNAFIYNNIHLLARVDPILGPSSSKNPSGHNSFLKEELYKKISQMILRKKTVSHILQGCPFLKIVSNLNLPSQRYCVKKLGKNTSTET